MSGRGDDETEDGGGGYRRPRSRDVLDLQGDGRQPRGARQPDDGEDGGDGRQRGRRERANDAQDEADDRRRPRRQRSEADDEAGAREVRQRHTADDDEDDRPRRDRHPDADVRRSRSDDADSERHDGKTGDKRRQSDGGSKKPRDNDEANKEDENEESRKRRERRRPVIFAVVAVVAVLGIVGGLYYWLSTKDLESTDDAFTDGQAVNIAPQVAGQVLSLDVADNQFVHKGDALIHIDPRQFIFDRDQSKGTSDSVLAQVESQKLGVEISKKNFPASLKLAQANLDAAKANLTLQSAALGRQKGLPKQATTQQDVDQAQSSYEQAKAQVEENEAKVTQAEPVSQNIGQSEQQVSQLVGQSEQAKAKLDQSNLNVEWAVVRAPQDGWVTQRNVETGNYVSAGQQIMVLVTPEIWVTANFKETQLDRMRPGQRVDITVDAYSNLKLRGHVDSIQRGSGSRFSAFPAQNATGNFVKIVQRVPVKIAIDSGFDQSEPLPIGISVVPSVSVR